MVKTGLGVGEEEVPSTIPAFPDFITVWTMFTVSELRAWEAGPVGRKVNSRYLEVLLKYPHLVTDKAVNYMGLAARGKVTSLVTLN